MKNRLLIMFLVASFVMTMLVCISPARVYAESIDEDQSQSLGDTLEEDMDWAEGEFFDGPLGKIVIGLFFIFVAIVNVISAVFSTIIAVVAGVGTFLWGIVEFFVGLFQ